MTLKIILSIVLTILYIIVSYFAGNHFWGDVDDRTIDKICNAILMALIFIALPAIVGSIGYGFYLLVNFIF